MWELIRRSRSLLNNVQLGRSTFTSDRLVNWSWWQLNHVALKSDSFHKLAPEYVPAIGVILANGQRHGRVCFADYQFLCQRNRMYLNGLHDGTSMVHKTDFLHYIFHECVSCLPC